MLFADLLVVFVREFRASIRSFHIDRHRMPSQLCLMFAFFHACQQIYLLVYLTNAKL